MTPEQVKEKLEGVKWISKEIKGLYLELEALEGGIIKKPTLSHSRIQASRENKRARKYFIIHYCYMRKKTMSECVEMAGTSSTTYHRYKQIAVLNYARIHQNGELEVYK